MLTNTTSSVSLLPAKKNETGLEYIRCSWGQPDIHTAAYSNTQRETWGRERGGQSMQSDRKKRGEGKTHVSACKDGGCVTYYTPEITF